MALLANVNTSFKISSARELMGVISQDRNTAIAGSAGQARGDVPARYLGRRRNEGAWTEYHMQMVNDRSLSPFLLQMAVFSAIDATERATGASRALWCTVSITFENRKEPVQLHNIYAADSGSAHAGRDRHGGAACLSDAGRFRRLESQTRSRCGSNRSTSKKDLNIGQVYLSRKEAEARGNGGTDGAAGRRERIELIAVV